METIATFFTVFFGVLLGLIFIAILLFIFGLLSPLFIQLLVNNPKKEPIRPNRIHFFTFIEPGQVKIIVRGKRFIRAIMNDPERKFLKRGDPRNADYWWVVPAKPEEISEPIPPLNRKNPISWWVHWVYQHTGAVFTGIWPFQGVRVEKNKRIRQKIENEKIVLDDKGLPVLEDVEDWSDHLRVKGFIWYFKVPITDAKDKLKIGFQGNLMERCINPYLATYNQDRWDITLSLKTSTLITSFCQSKNFEELSASDSENKHELGDFLKKNLNDFLSPLEIGSEEKRGVGMETLQADITDRDPQLDPAERLSLTEPWKAEQTKKATIKTAEGTKQKKILESEGDAQAVLNNIVAVKTDEEIGRMLIEYNAWKESAKAGGATFFFGDNRGGSKELDPIVFAKLEEIRKQLASKADKPEKTGADAPKEPEKTAYDAIKEAAQKGKNTKKGRR